jgi:hypothetical protein
MDGTHHPVLSRRLIRGGAILEVRSIAGLPALQAPAVTFATGVACLLLPSRLGAGRCCKARQGKARATCRARFRARRR